MTQPQEPEPTRSAGAGSDQPPGVPNWVKISAIVVAILVVAVIVAMLLGGNHGPGRHMSAPFASAAPLEAASQSLWHGEHVVW